jgi:hypothetical protein
LDDLNTDPIPRARHALTRNELATFMDLFAQRPWLEQKSERVHDLWELCLSIDEQMLLASLLHRFEFITSQLLETILRGFQKQITEVWSLNSNSTKIVALNDGSDADSSQAILWHLKSALTISDGWSSKQLVNSLVLAAKKTITDGIDVVLVDEFVGTGKQASRRINWLKSQLALRNCKPRRIYVCVVARLQNPQYDITPLVDGYYSGLTLKRGLSDHLDGPARDAALSQMLRLESELLPMYRKSRLPSLGYGKSEALYSSEAGNTPNNVFPIFWWKWLKNGISRKPLVQRLGD